MFLSNQHAFLFQGGRRKNVVVFAIILLASFTCSYCGPKEKGKVKVTAFVHNRSGHTLLVTGPTVDGTDSILNETEFVFIQEKLYRSESKPLCCPCAGKVSDFTFRVADTSKKLSKNLDDAELWQKQTMVKLDYWVCRINLEPSDIVNR